MQQTEKLPVTLSREEREERAAEMSTTISTLLELKAANKEKKRQMKVAEDLLECKVHELARVHREGEELRQVEVARQADLRRALWCVVRLDTGEQVRTEPMTARDMEEARQERLPGLQ